MKMSKRFPISYIGVSVSTFLLHPIFNFSSCSAKADVCQLSTYRPLNVVRSSTLQALQGLGHSKKDAEIITDVLIFAELRGNNQGLIKLVSGGLNKNFESKEINNLLESPVSCKIDGGQRIGMVVVAHATSIAIDKAKKSGIAVVGCSNYASATGALGYWARKITDAGLIGIVMSQCNEMVAPHGSYEPIFGTNPIAIGIPTLPRPQILDMATSASAYYGIKMAESMGIPIASDIAYDCHGRETTDPSAALKGAIRVFDRSFKGSHLALMVELLAGVQKKSLRICI
jgi:L-2-hydroxycarboxylate dehydrogenase (NAD+)